MGMISRQAGPLRFSWQNANAGVEGQFCLSDLPQHTQTRCCSSAWGALTPQPLERSRERLIVSGNLLSSRSQHSRAGKTRAGAVGSVGF